MKFSTAIATLFATTVAVSAAPAAVNKIPTGGYQLGANAPDGLYTHEVARNGTIITQYHGTLNLTAPASHGKRGGLGSTCQDLTFSAEDASAAILLLTQGLNTNNQFNGAIKYVHGTAQAYGCDYGHGQTISGTQVTGFLQMVINQCGQAKAGYWNIPEWKALYGITTAGAQICH